MNLSIDFETLTMDEADLLEEATGVGLDAIGKKLQDPDAPKMGILKALAAIAYRRDNGGTAKAAMAAVGKLPITTLADGLEVTSEGNPPEGSGQ